MVGVDDDLVAHLRRQAGGCKCLGCCHLRRWADYLAIGRQPPEEMQYEEDCPCRGCRGIRYGVVLEDGGQGNPEPTLS